MMMIMMMTMITAGEWPESGMSLEQVDVMEVAVIGELRENLLKILIQSANRAILRVIQRRRRSRLTDRLQGIKRVYPFRAMGIITNRDPRGQ